MTESISPFAGLVIASVSAAIVAILLSVGFQWLMNRMSDLSISIGGVEIQLRRDDLDKSIEDIERTVSYLKRSPSVFISYASPDREFALRLAKDLNSYGIKPWIADLELHVGDKIEENIRKALSSSQWVILVLSQSFLDSKWVSIEYELAISEEEQRGRPFLLPVIPNTEPRDVGFHYLPEPLRGRMIADFREGYEDGLESLLRGIWRDLDGVESTS